MRSLLLCVGAATLLAVASCESGVRDGDHDSDDAPANEEQSARDVSIPLIGVDGTYPEPEYALFPLMRRIDIVHEGTLETIRLEWHEDNVVYDQVDTPIARIDREWWSALIDKERRRPGGAVRSGGDFVHSENDGYNGVAQFLYERAVEGDSLVLRNVGKYVPSDELPPLIGE